MDFIDRLDKKLSIYIHNLYFSLLEIPLSVLGLLFNQYLIWVVPFYIFREYKRTSMMSIFDKKYPEKLAYVE